MKKENIGSSFDDFLKEQGITVVMGVSATPMRMTSTEAARELGLLSEEKPKKVKFHNNLRSKLNNGSIKWL